jgi:prepilin signal peptidase PulO-like enzyme (type II secretory pathway)
MKRVFPFGPSIAAACIITMLVGKPLITWYIGLL